MGKIKSSSNIVSQLNLRSYRKFRILNKAVIAVIVLKISKAKMILQDPAGVLQEITRVLQQEILARSWKPLAEFLQIPARNGWFSLQHFV